MNSSKTFQNGVMLNAYPDSIGDKLSDCVELLKESAFEDVFSYFYLLPTVFHSDLDRGFSIIDYDLNEELVTQQDIDGLKSLGIALKFDIVLNHLSVASPQFKDLIKKGNDSEFKDFFINWNHFWQGYGEMNGDGVMIPNSEYLGKLFMRKAGLPILKVPFPDGSEQPYWNTFYQKINYSVPTLEQFMAIESIEKESARELQSIVQKELQSGKEFDQWNLENYDTYRESVAALLNQNKTFLGQMDVNAQSELVWDFYNDVLKKLKQYGGSIIRLDAFAYLHKEVGETNFFNRPGTWDYLQRINGMATEQGLALLPEIHAEYGAGVHKEVADEGYLIYDFFFPGLVIHTIEKNDPAPLLNWIEEIQENNYRTVHMLGSHDGIPVLDLKGKSKDGVYVNGLLQDAQIEEMINTILDRGGRVKNLFGPDGSKISYYQVNATFFSALGEDPDKLLLARAIQMFMPGIPQVWYLDLFAGKNDYEAADRAGKGGHKEINRTNLSITEIQKSLQTEIVQKQLELMRLRNTHQAFAGSVEVAADGADGLNFKWRNGVHTCVLLVDLTKRSFSILVDGNRIEL